MNYETQNAECWRLFFRWVDGPRHLRDRREKEYESAKEKLREIISQAKAGKEAA